MPLKISNGLINLANLHQQTDEIIFDHIDSKANWDKAYQLLDPLLEECVANFLKVVQDNQNEIPKGDTYWNLFLQINSKLLFFSSLALKNGELKSKLATDEFFAQRFQQAAHLLTNVHTEENELFIEEIKMAYKEVADESTFEVNKNQSVNEALAIYMEFAKQY